MARDASGFENKGAKKKKKETAKRWATSTTTTTSVSFVRTFLFRFLPSAVCVRSCALSPIRPASSSSVPLGRVTEWGIRSCALPAANQSGAIPSIHPSIDATTVPSVCAHVSSST